VSEPGWNTALVAGTRLRTLAILSLAALLLHELRYIAGYGAAAESTLAEHGHGYLGAVAPLVALLASVAVLELVLQLVRARRGYTGRPTPSRFAARWGAAALALFVIYFTQELLEGALLAGHPTGLSGVLGDGGWVATALAVMLGAGVAAFLRGAELLVRRATRRRRDARRARTRSARPPQFSLPRIAPLAACAAGRAPPRSLAF